MIQHVNFVLSDMTQHNTLHTIGGIIIALGALALIVAGSSFLSWGIRSSYREQVREITQQEKIAPVVIKVVDGVFVPVLVVISPGERISFLNTDQHPYTLVCGEYRATLDSYIPLDRTIYTQGTHTCSISSHESIIIVK